MICVRMNGATETLLAHRVSWFLSHGEDPGVGMYVCHRCDNPACVRPDHLFLGTPTDNMRDMIRKGRQVIGVRIGTRNGNNMLSELEALEIGELCRKRVGQREIARRYGVCQGTVSHIACGRIWGHLTGIRKGTNKRTLRSRPVGI